jgi:hypothetical protein
MRARVLKSPRRSAGRRGQMGGQPRLPRLGARESLGQNAGSSTGTGATIIRSATTPSARAARHSRSTERAMSKAVTEKRGLRSLVPSITSIRSMGRWLCTIAGSTAMPLRQPPSTGSSCTVVRPGNPSAITCTSGPRGGHHIGPARRRAGGGRSGRSGRSAWCHGCCCRHSKARPASLDPPCCCPAAVLRGGGGLSRDLRVTRLRPARGRKAFRFPIYGG